jgi:hypothetical protein
MYPACLPTAHRLIRSSLLLLLHYVEALEWMLLCLRRIFQLDL